mgnify:CR=1 FL=1
MNLSSTIKSIQDIMRKDDGVDGDAQRLGQLTWMLFLKVLDQREEEWEDDDPSYLSPLDEALRWRHWAAYLTDADGKKAPQKTPSEIIGFVNNQLFPHLKELDASDSPLHKVIRSVFEDANNYMKSGPQMLAVIEKLEEEGKQYDVVILDPPAFTKSRSSVKNAVKGYREINLRAMKLVKDGGFLATCSCSHFMDYQLFTQTIGQAARNVHKRLRQVEYRTQAPDHPILWSADESYYLKFYIFQVCSDR